ncbi:hypothetical protein [Tepidibacter thalassicus]|uniref:Uncharacterized protein n=1 Tax=Tepidibacter thalassicus DSM 15285 TaxID=1123350 RepID=A0A1M5PEU8_9FIRM|nr:hypothetical protein [Tepidibacter thalassicus]SHH00275.1 hypothetical protein SAMN02744040_00444 [Tepidibacter thalassicus DSM 15285]
MSCKTYNTTTYTKDDNKKGIERTCCSANTSCITPRTYDPEKITAECIFVEKVYDSIIIHKEVDVTPEFPIVSDVISCITSPCEIIKVDITCSAKNVIITPEITRINGEVIPPPFPTVPGPSGLDQIDLSFIDTSKCDKEGKGTPIYIAQTLNISGELNLEITGEVRKHATGNIKTFKTNATIPIPDGLSINAFAHLCIPSTAYAMKPSLAEFCSAMCEFILPNGLDDLELVGSPCNTSIQINGAFITLCLTCEKKIKVPVQLCVLSTGFCQAPEQQGLCAEFPQLFPDQINKKIIDDDDC